MSVLPLRVIEEIQREPALWHTLSAEDIDDTITSLVERAENLRSALVEVEYLAREAIADEARGDR